MNYDQLVRQVFQKKSMLCVGLDTDRSKIPPHLLDREDPMFEFNKQMVDATRDLSVAYKLNLAFYESEGVEGLLAMDRTATYIKETCPEIFTIADAKRGDIGNTSQKYAEAYFQKYAFDSITISPYMGSDSVMPYLDFTDKWAILLALTSNPSSSDFQTEKYPDGETLYQKVLRKSSEWGDHRRIMYVVGATRSEHLLEIRTLVPDHFLLVPGIGTQKGDLSQVCRFGSTSEGGLLINVGRAVIYAGAGEDFAEAARHTALRFVEEMRRSTPALRE